jgi:hypothetical protein
MKVNFNARFFVTPSGEDQARGRKLLSILCFWLGLISASCGHVLYVDGPYHGRLVDKATRKPIEGAAVVAVWEKITPSVGHYIEGYYDAQETVTDQDGNFTIPGIVGGSPNPLVKIREPLFTMFKPGYASYGALKAFKPISAPSGIEVSESGGRVIFALPPLRTKEDRRTDWWNVRVRSDVPEDKYLRLIELKRSEAEQLGIQHRGIR